MFALFDMSECGRAFFAANFTNGGQGMGEENYTLLADAIVIQAAKDYRRTSSPTVRDEIRRFFLSDRFRDLTDVDGRKILRKLDEELNAKKSRRKRQ